ncbi:MAG: tyrosine-protein phosphatase [bacterium]
MKILLTVIVLLIAGVAVFFSGNNFHVVEPDQVFRSAQLDAVTLSDKIREHDIRTVINLRGANAGKDWYDAEKRVADKLSIDHFDVRLVSTQLPTYPELQRLLELLDQAPRPLLIHCAHGADRSGLASALLLLLTKDADPQLASEQTSWKYRVLRPNSTGRLFLAQYQGWLDENEAQHTPEILRRWIREDYQDEKGNFAFYIDRINDTVWKNGTQYVDGYEYDIRGPVLIQGWAVDAKAGGSVRNIELMLGGETLAGIESHLSRPGVAAYFSNPGYLQSGWRLSADLGDKLQGCENLSLRLARNDGSYWESPPQAILCSR